MNEPLPPLSTIGAPRILVIGDVMLDEYLWGEVSRISPEAPVPVIAGRHLELKVGGAGSVFENLVVLGADVELCGLIGRDEAGDRLIELLSRRGLPTAGLVRSGARRTTRKTRMMAYVQHANRALQQALRVDWEDIQPPDAEERTRLREFLDAWFRRGRPAAVLVSDYEKGLLDEPMLGDIIERSTAASVPVLVDPGRSVDYARYRGATLLCPNRYEASHAADIAMTDEGQYRIAGTRLVERLGIRYAALTLDREGIFLVKAPAKGRGDCEAAAFPTRVRMVTDVAGAGDMVLSLLGIALASGWTIEQAVLLANVGAGIEVSKVGVTPVERWEIEQAIASTGDPSRSKVVSVEELRRIAERGRAARRRMAFANGCFDLLHAGHVVLLEKARAFGDYLVVALNSDASVRRLKGEGRPIHDARERGLTLSAVAAVDHIVFFEDDTPLGLIDDVRPDVLVKGDDYRGREVVGRELVESWGGRLELVPLEPHLSTSHVIERIRSLPG